MFSVMRNRKARQPRGAVRVHKKQISVNVLSNRGVRRWMLFFILLALSTTVAWYAKLNWQQNMIPLEHISIDGDFRYLSPLQLQKTINANIRGGYFTVDLAAIRQALLQLPWVQEVSVRRQWPSGLRVQVEEKRAVAYWGDAALLSDRGEVFVPETLSRDMALTTLRGPDATHETVWKFANKVTGSIAALGLALKKLELDARRAWQIELENGATIKLGRDDAVARLQRFARVYAMSNLPAFKDAAVIDMRYPNGFAILAADTLSKDNNNNTSLSDTDRASAGLIDADVRVGEV